MIKRARLLDKGFRYYPSSDTDVARTFARVRRQMKEAEKAKLPAANVKPLKKEQKRG
jgi:hypothetical protein